MSRIEADQAPWEKIERRFEELLKSDASASPRAAVTGLLNRVHAVATARADAGKSFDNAINYVAVDPENLVSRIAYALLQDLKTLAAAKAVTTAPASKPAAPIESVDPMARFLAMQEVVEGATRVRRAAVYNTTLFDTWRVALDGYFVRPDVAASLGWQSQYFMRGDFRNGCWTLLPLVADRLMSLAGELRNSGHANEAAACERWLGSCALGILQSEKDTPTRLLAADLLRRALTGPLDKQIREGAERFRLDVHAAMDESDVDFCNQGFVSAKSVAPAEYRRATTILVASGATAAMGAGAGVAFALSILFLPFAVLIRRRHSAIANVTANSPVNEQGHSSKMEWLTALLLLSTIGGLLAFRFAFDRYYSVSAAIYLAIVMVGSGGAIGLVIGSMRSRGRMVAYMLAAGIVVLVALPLSVHAWTARFLSLTLGSEFVAISIAIGLIATAAILSGASIREIAHGSAKTWLIGLGLACALYSAHVAFDKSYSQAAVSGYADEVAARLGADWQQKYFKDAIARYDVTHP